jgi:hypothetical protein
MTLLRVVVALYRVDSTTRCRATTRARLRRTTSDCGLKQRSRECSS